jgi:beta-lactamase superfamily II metal-dependent hydrolase
MDRLAAKGITVYRTDTQGTIVLKTDGEKFTYVEK